MDWDTKNTAEKLAALDRMSVELLETDYQGADAEQHLLAAEGFLTVHGRMISEYAGQITTDSIDHLLTRARIHVALAEARSWWR